MEPYTTAGTQRTKNSNFLWFNLIIFFFFAIPRCTMFDILTMPNGGKKSLKHKMISINPKN